MLDIVILEAEYVGTDPISDAVVAAGARTPINGGPANLLREPNIRIANGDHMWHESTSKARERIRQDTS